MLAVVFNDRREHVQAAVVGVVDSVGAQKGRLHVHRHGVLKLVGLHVRVADVIGIQLVVAHQHQRVAHGHRAHHAVLFAACDGRVALGGQRGHGRQQKRQHGQKRQNLLHISTSS